MDPLSLVKFKTNQLKLKSNNEDLRVFFCLWYNGDIFKGDSSMANTAPVWVYDKDIATGELLQEPRRLDGKSGTDYHVSPAAIKQYEYVDNSGKLTGVFGDLPQT